MRPLLSSVLPLAYLLAHSPEPECPPSHLHDQAGGMANKLGDGVLDMANGSAALKGLSTRRSTSWPPCASTSRRQRRHAARRRPLPPQTHMRRQAGHLGLLVTARMSPTLGTSVWCTTAVVVLPFPPPPPPFNWVGAHSPHPLAPSPCRLPLSCCRGTRSDPLSSWTS